MKAINTIEAETQSNDNVEGGSPNVAEDGPDEEYLRVVPEERRPENACKHNGDTAKNSDHGVFVCVKDVCKRDTSDDHDCDRRKETNN